MNLNAFTESGDWGRWSKVRSLQVTVTVAAEGLPAYVRTETLRSDASRMNLSGSSWFLPLELA